MHLHGFFAHVLNLIIHTSAGYSNHVREGATFMFWKWDLDLSFGAFLLILELITYSFQDSAEFEDPMKPEEVRLEVKQQTELIGLTFPVNVMSGDSM